MWSVTRINGMIFTDFIRRTYNGMKKVQQKTYSQEDYTELDASDWKLCVADSVA